MTTKRKRTFGPAAYLNLLTVLFVAMKLGGVIDWSWWLVLAPSIFWVITLILIYAILGALTAYMHELAERNSRR